MNTVLLAAEIIIAILLIIVVVAQESKTHGMGAVSGASASTFGGKQRGVDGLLNRLTIILGIVFAVLSLILGARMNMF